MNNARRGIVLLPILLVAGALLLLLGGLALWRQMSKSVEAVPAQACTCDDSADIQNRLAEAKAAIGEYQTAIGEFAARPDTKYSDALYQAEQENVQLAINAATRRGTNKVSGDTRTDCTTIVKAATACMKASGQTHENVHASSCNAMKAAGRAYRGSMTIIEAWKEEISGYTAEIAYLNRNLAGIKSANCWTCDVDGKSYAVRSDCERGCRPTLGSTIKLGLRCTQAK
ncbi:MAG: hypothetical protein ACM336_20555 [Acidobacteriota bacterium]